MSIKTLQLYNFSGKRSLMRKERIKPRKDKSKKVCAQVAFAFVFKFVIDLNELYMNELCFFFVFENFNLLN